MNDQNLLKVGTKVYHAPQGFAPAGTEENPNPAAPARPTGVVRGIQALEDPVSYLVVKDEDGTNEWISEASIEPVEVQAEEESEAA